MKGSQPITCLISDLGQVLLWFDNGKFFRAAAEFSPFSPEEISRLVHQNRSFIEAFDTGRMEPKAFYREVVREIRGQMTHTAFFKIYNDVFSLNRPVLDLYKSLKTRCRMVLLSNTDPERFGFIRKRFPEIFIFDAYVLSFEVGHLKPHPRIYEEALKKAGAPPGQCLFIDDIPQNIQGAEKLGLRTIQYTPETDLKGALETLGLVVPSASV
ncbi:MAG: HAD family hydrolase [Candidatus Aminicenantales bacterium]